MTELTVDGTDDGDRVVLTLTGELDIESVDAVRQQAGERIASGRYRALTLDMSGITFLDSSGLGLLLELRLLARSSDVAFSLQNVPPSPARVIGIAGLTDTLGVSDSDGTRPDAT